MSFDITKFSVSNNQQQSLVGDFTLTETKDVTTQDIKVVAGDTFMVVGLTSFMLFPSAACIWYNSSIPFMYVAVVSLSVVGIMGLWRYDHNTRGLMGRVHESRGQVNWLHTKINEKSSSKAELRFFKENSNSRPTITNVIKSTYLSADQVIDLAVYLINNGKFTQDSVTKIGRVSASVYGFVCDEFLEQGLITFKGETAKQGYKVTLQGYQLFGQLAASRASTPLLAAHESEIEQK